MNTNPTEIKPVSVPTTLRLLDLEPRIVAICTKFNVQPPDVIRLAVRMLCERVESTGRYEIPPMGSAPITPQATDEEHKAVLAKAAASRSKVSARR